MIEFSTLGHICIIVDNIDESIEFYKELFGAVPVQCFSHFKNNGFAKSAGFVDNPELVDVSIAFVKIPTQEGLILELMEYHSPKGKYVENKKEATDLNLVAHIALRVKNINKAFDHVKNCNGVRLITSHKDYRPFKIDSISENDFIFYDKTLESNIEEKKQVCRIIEKIHYFYFVDKYGVQWELEEGHDDIGSKVEI